MSSVNSPFITIILVIIGVKYPPNCLYLRCQGSRNESAVNLVVRTGMSYVVPPRLLSRAEWTVTSLAGSEVTLPCEVTGDPWPVIRWSRDQLVIDMYSDDHKLLMRDSGSLVIPAVSVDDAASYQCVAENPAGVVSQDITLIVHGTYDTPTPASHRSHRRSLCRCLYS